MTKRIVGTAAVGAVVGVVMVLLGMEPRLVLVGLVVVTVATTAFLLVDVGGLAAPVDWYRHQLDEDTTASVDQRVQDLRWTVRRSTSRRLSSAYPDSGRADPVVASLVGVLDDVLLTDHGIDQAADPDAAEAVLGPELAALVADPAAHGTMSRRHLDRIVTLVEALCEADRSETRR